MSAAYKMAKKYYESGLWSEERLQALVKKGKLTEEEYNEIVGDKTGSTEN